MESAPIPGPALTTPLPADIARGEFGSGWYYERFSAFGWEWAWRRSLLFGTVAFIFGAMTGIVHGLYSKQFSDGLAVGWRSAIAASLAVIAGPLLASLVRRARYSLQVEHAAVIGTVTACIALSWILRIYAQTYHDHMMGAAMPAAQRWINVLTGRWPLPAALENLTAFVAGVTVQAIAGGVLALRSYLDEPRRWRDYLTRREVETLRQEKLAAEAHLAVLQAQVEPHFLFNTLASASAEIDIDPQRAKRLVHALAQYLRTTLPRIREIGGGSLSTVSEQFEICSRYLEIVKLRLGDRLSYVLEMRDDVAVDPFPPFLLISLVENAVTHGAEPKPGRTEIKIAACHLGTGTDVALQVLVQDDGFGFHEGLLEGTGISNVRSQLATLFGGAARLVVEAPATGGAHAGITIPLRLLRL